MQTRQVVLGAVLLAAALVVVGLIVLVVMFRDPLPEVTAADVAAAERRWEENGPAGYDLDLKLGGATPGIVHVEVRDGEVTAMTRDGRVPSQRRTWDVWSVRGQFEMIHQELDMASDPEGRMQAKPGTQLILRGEFHPELGYPLRFRRLVLGEGPEVYWEVTRFKAFVVPPSGGS